MNGRALLNGLMETLIKEISKMIREPAEALLNGTMETLMKEISKMIKWTEGVL